MNNFGFLCYGFLMQIYSDTFLNEGPNIRDPFQKMLESRPEDALVNVVTTVEIVETAETVDSEETEETLQTV